MRGSFLKGVAVGAVCVLVGGVATVALAGSGVGGVFNLGVSNTVDGSTVLSGSTSGGIQLDVRNNSGTAGSSAIRGLSSALAWGVWGQASGGGGVFGRHASLSGTTPGVRGDTSSTAANAYGVLGQVTSTTPGSNSAAVRGINAGTGGAGAGVYGSHAGSGWGVYGTAPNGRGVFGSSTSGVGVYGNAPSGTGVLGSSSNGNGVNGVSSSGAGVFGSSPNGIGVIGQSPNNNGVQGSSSSSIASGVYGQNSAGGYGVAGRSPNGVGVYGESLGGPNAHGVSALSDGPGGTILATNSGAGPALELHSSGPPISVDSTTRVDNLNADKVDGASILSNRIISTTPLDHILQLPGFGDFNVTSCNHTNASFEWSSGGPNAYVTWYDVFNPADDFQGIATVVSSFARPHHFVTVQLARNTGAGTSIATVTVTTNGPDCVFAAQAVVQPG
jgi:hypothetical protein